MATQTTAPKPKSTFYSPYRPNIKYEFLCAATPGNFDTMRKRFGLNIHVKSQNGNITLQCTKSWSRCKYRGLFIPKDNAIYVIQGRAHNHPVKVPANEDEEGTSSAKAAQNDEDYQDEYMDEDKENEGIDEEAMEEEEEADVDLVKERKLVEDKRKRLLTHVQNGQHLARICDQNTLQEVGRYFRCKRPNCPFRATFLCDESDMYVYNQHNH